MKRPHVITADDLERMHTETYEMLIATGPSMTELRGSNQYKRIVVQAQNNDMRWIVRIGRDDVQTFATMDAAVEKYNEL